MKKRTGAMHEMYIKFLCDTYGPKMYSTRYPDAKKKFRVDPRALRTSSWKTVIVLNMS